jgi:hypothetical protein
MKPVRLTQIMAARPANPRTTLTRPASLPLIAMAPELGAPLLPLLVDDAVEDLLEEEDFDVVVVLLLDVVELVDEEVVVVVLFPVVVVVRVGREELPDDVVDPDVVVDPEADEEPEEEAEPPEMEKRGL